MLLNFSSKSSLWYKIFWRWIFCFILKCVFTLFWCVCAQKYLPVISYFLSVFFFSHSLILPSTSRLRINYMSIEWPLGGGIDIHGPPSAPRPMCIPQHRSPAFCITPGLHYLLYFSVTAGREGLFGEEEKKEGRSSQRKQVSLFQPSQIYAQFTHKRIQDTSSEPNGTEQN